MQTLRDLLEHEIRDLYNAQIHLQTVRPDLVERVADAELKKALRTHVGETEDQVDRLKRCARLLEIEPTGVKCHAMEGILREARELEEASRSDQVRDAAVLIGVQKIEHYEIASYGGAATWAEMLELDEVASLLKACVAEAKKADEALTAIAKDHVDVEAATVPSGLRGGKI